MRSHQNSHTLMVGIENNSAALENRSEVCEKFSTHPFYAQHFHTQVVTWEKSDYVYISLVQEWFIYSHQKLETIQASFNMRNEQWPRFRMPPKGRSGQEAACQCTRCRRQEFNPWAGKIPWRRNWQPTPGFLPGEIPWTEDPGGVAKSPWGCKELDTTEHSYTSVDWNTTRL